jgi:hypothetical protein
MISRPFLKVKGEIVPLDAAGKTPPAEIARREKWEEQDLWMVVPRQMPTKIKGVSID